MKLERAVATQQVIDTLKEWIRERRLTPGDWIRQDAVASTLGVSRVPVREALRGLAAEGLVEIIPHRGARVVRLSWRRFLEAAVLRSIIEPVCCRFVVERVTSEGVERLKGAFERLKAAELGDMPEGANANSDGGNEAFERNWEFHMTLFSLSRYDTLVEMIEGLWASTAAYRSIYLADEHMASRELQSEHKAMVAAVKSRDLEGLVELHARHRERMQNFLRAHVFAEEAIGDDEAWLLHQLTASDTWSATLVKSSNGAGRSETT